MMLISSAVSTLLFRHLSTRLLPNHLVQQSAMNSVIAYLIVVLHLIAMTYAFDASGTYPINPDGSAQTITVECKKEFLEKALDEFQKQRKGVKVVSSCVVKDESFMGGYDCAVLITAKSGKKFSVSGLLYYGGGVRKLAVKRIRSEPYPSCL
ncbi:hypothetical protein AB6A40_007415 [Gnathostoma spinigerum]|uniref:Uncharacterized protein n=1 Tax=Gnathostoma spinigerum TaxID=75299 RepID=A0ABD6ELQ1_9BILA